MFEPQHRLSTRAVLILALLALGLAGLVLYPLLGRGYLMSLDVYFGPLRPLEPRAWPAAADPEFSDAVSILPLEALFSLFNHGLLRPWVGKGFLFLTVAGAALSTALVTSRGSMAGRIYAMGLVAVNPWFYSRLSVTQLGVLAGYALLPLAVAVTIRFVSRPTAASLWAAAFVFAAVGVADPRYLYLLAGMLMVFVVWYAINDGRVITTVRRTAIWVAGLAGLLVMLLSYWLVTLVMLPSSTVARLSATDPSLFATRSDSNLGIVFNTAALYGFWREVDPIKNHLVGWWLLACLIFILAAVGFVALWRDRERRWVAGALLTVWFLAMFVSMGTSFGPTASAWLFLFDHLPGFAVLREPQKASAFLVLVYAFLGAAGVDRLLPWWRTVRAGRLVHANVLMLVLLAVPLLYGYREFAGLWGRLRPREYPQSWYEAADYLEQHNPDDAVLFFPWHYYMAFTFSGNRTIANPVRVFFPGRVLRSDSPELGGLAYPPSPNPVITYIEALLEYRGELQDFGNLVAPLGVKYILLSMNADYPRYDFLDRATDLKLVRAWDDLRLYENLRPVHRFYAVTGEVAVPDVAALIELSHEQDLTSGLYLVGDGDVPTRRAGGASAAAASATPYEQRNPLSYQVDRPEGRWLVFADPYSDSWRYDGQQPLRNLGVVNAFPAADGPAELSARGTNWRVVGYVVSVVTLSVGVADLARRWRRGERP